MRGKIYYKLIILNFALVILFLISCGSSEDASPVKPNSSSSSSSTSTTSSSSSAIITDTTFDTILIKHDSLNFKDSVIFRDSLIFRDSIIFKDSIRLKDKIIFKDSIIIHDSIVIRDSIIYKYNFKDSIIFNIKDSIILKDSSIIHFKDSLRIRDSIIIKDSIIIIRDTIFDTVTVIHNNQKPTISFISPSKDTTIFSGQSLTVEVNATDDDSITKVDLFINNQFIRSEKIPPYQWNNSNQDPLLQNLQQGTYTLKAIAFDSYGDSSIATISLKVEKNDLVLDYNSIIDTIEVVAIGHGTYATKILTDTIPKRVQLSKYGGDLNHYVGATGFFYVTQIDSVWYFVDSDGYLFYSIGVTSVTQGGGINLPDDLKNKAGINVMGNWSDETIQNIPFSPHYNFLASFKNTTPERQEMYDNDIFPVFDDDFKTWVDEQAQQFTSKYVNNPWVIGYYTDNEINFHHSTIESYLSLPDTNPNYIATKEWLTKYKGENFPLDNLTEDDQDAFRAYIAETYMSTVNSALKKYDPHHLNLGCRIHSKVKWKPKIIKALGAHVDVLSINFYGRWAPTKEEMDMWLENAGVPFLISEFYTKGQDTGMLNEDGAGWTVATQQDRAYFFYNMALTLLSHKGSVGWTWFRYIDKNDSNKGIISEQYTWYEPLVFAMKNISNDVYNLRTFLLKF